MNLYERQTMGAISVNEGITPMAGHTGYGRAARIAAQEQTSKKEKESMKILISTSAYNHQVNNEMVHSLLREFQDLRTANIGANWHTPVSSALAFNRNLAVDIALMDGYEWLLFWDADICVEEMGFI